MIYGYCRVSTPKQNIERQERNIKSAYPTAVILKDQWTGTTLNRPEWGKLMKRAKKGSTIVFDSVSRMSRSSEEGVSEYFRLYDKGINLVFLNEPQISSDVYRKACEDTVPMTGTDADLILTGINAYIRKLAENQIRIAFEQSEKEVKDLQERTRQGIETARLAGKHIGGVEGRKIETAKAKKAKELILKYSNSFEGSCTDTEVITICGISRNSYYKYKGELYATEGVERKSSIVLYKDKD